MEKQQPIVKKKLGRFQVSVWKRKILFSAKTDNDVGREVEVVNVCVQHSRFNQAKKQWNNQSIWCNASELNNLAKLLDDMNLEELNVSRDAQ